MQSRNYSIICPIVMVMGLLINTCSMEETTVKNADYSGAYSLVSVDGKSVPASISHEGPTIQIRSGIFTIKADGTCSSIIIMVPPSGSEVKRKVGATYTLDGSTLSMQWQGAGKTEGTIEGNTFTMVNEGIHFVYRK